MASAATAAASLATMSITAADSGQTVGTPARARPAAESEPATPPMAPAPAGAEEQRCPDSLAAQSPPGAKVISAVADLCAENDGPVLKGKVTRPRGGGLLVVRGWQPRPADAGALLRSRATSANCCSRLHPRATRPRCSASTCGATRAPPVAPVACARLAGQARQRTLSRARSTLASDVKNYELIPQHLKLKLTLSSGRGLESPGVLPTSFKNRFVFAFRWKTVKKARSASIAVAALQAGV